MKKCISFSGFCKNKCFFDEINIFLNFLIKTSRYLKSKYISEIFILHVFLFPRV